jgi:hypothetical protein
MMRIVALVESGIDGAGDVEFSPREFRRPKRELARRNIVDRTGDSCGPRLFRGQERPAAPADLEQTHQPILMPGRLAAMRRESEHGGLVHVPGPNLPAIISKRTQGLGEKGRCAQAARDPRLPSGHAGSGGGRDRLGIGYGWSRCGGADTFDST